MKLLLACLLAVAMLPQSATAQAPDVGSIDARYAGRSLTDALLDLQEQGLQIVFTDSIVLPKMTVTVEPTSTDLRGILEELLAEHGLDFRDGPQGTVVVVPQTTLEAIPFEPALRGVVRSRRTMAPIQGVVVHVVESDRSALSSADGSFIITGLAAGAHTLEIVRRGFVVEVRQYIALLPTEDTTISILLDPAPITEEALIVTPSRISLLREMPVALFGLSRDQLSALPHLGTDFFRALTLLPGATANDVTAQFHVRGSRRNETQILLDGQELYEAHHLKDYDSAMSIISSTTLESVDLTTGGFSAEYGDRMSGVLDMKTMTPAGRPRTRIGINTLNANLSSAGGFGNQRGSWLAEARRGSIDLAGKLLGKENPSFLDLFGKLDYQFTPSQSGRVNLLYSDDRLGFSEVDGPDSKDIRTEYSNFYTWITHQALLNSDLVLETAGSISRIDRDRRGIETEEDARFSVRDIRESQVLGLRQGWHYQASRNHLLKWGFELRSFDADYDYSSFSEFDNPLSLVRQDPHTAIPAFRESFEEEHSSVHLSDRIGLGEKLNLNLGLRFDQHTLTDEDLLSPRFNLAYALGEKSVIRAAWGKFNQSQRPYELQVEDSDTTFYPVERSEHRVLGIERIFSPSRPGPEFMVRVEIYQRSVRNPIPRYENLYEPINKFPEVEPDRVKIAAERSLAEGAELFLRGGFGIRVAWWLNYTYASSDDRIDGRWVPRSFDQTHALNMDVNLTLTENWDLNLAWRYHTGWPTTSLTLTEEVDEDGESVFVPTLGPLNAERLGDYHRLDLRASREWQRKRGPVKFYIDIQNVYNRKNAAGFDYEIDEEEGTILANQEEWAGILPSIGVSFEF